MSDNSSQTVLTLENQGPDRCVLNIEIKNWDKYNPRSDAKRWSWFRFQNDFFDDDNLCDLSGRQKLLLVYLFTRRNKADKVVFQVNPRHAAARVDSDAKEVIADLLAIAAAGIISVETNVDVRERTLAYVNVRERPNPFPTDGRTDVTDDTNVTDGRGDGVSDPPTLPVPVKRTKSPPAEKTPSSRVWAAYAAAYEQRYGHAPPRNAKANGQCAQLVARLGAEDAERVVAFYLTHGGAYYVRSIHPLGACLKDAEGLRTQMLAGHRVTASEAQKQDRQLGNVQVFSNVLKKLEGDDGR